jgi:hypothetical protein
VAILREEAAPYDAGETQVRARAGASVLSHEADHAARDLRPAALCVHSSSTDEKAPFAVERLFGPIYIRRDRMRLASPP